MKTIYTLIYAAVIVVIFSGCAGKNGTDGAPGAQGPTGNANVSSITFTINQNDWNGEGTSVVTANLPDAAITQDIFNNGGVLAYWQSELETEYIQMPFSNGTYDYNDISSVGNLEIVISNIAADNFNGLCCMKTTLKS